MKIIRRFKTPDGKEFVALRTQKGDIVIALDPHAYQDIKNMPSTIDAGFGVQIYNYTAITLWFTVIGSGGEPDWSWASVKQLGSVGSGANKTIHVPSLGSRTKPPSAVDDGTMLTFRAYSDSGYTTEIGDGYAIVVTYHWLDSDAMTLLDEDNFDGGTLEDWTQSGWLSLGVATDYVLSSPNSAKAERGILLSYSTWTGIIKKSFTVPAATVAYLIANVKFVGYIKSGQTASAKVQVREMRISKAGSIIARTGASPYLFEQPYNVVNKQTNWLRMVAPIDVDETAEYRLETVYYLYSSSSAYMTRLRAYYDNLKVVYE